MSIMSSNSTPYKGYGINPKPRKNDTNKWDTHISIERYDSGILSEKAFSTANLHNSEAEAIAFCIQYGRDIIDGKVVGCTINDL